MKELEKQALASYMYNGVGSFVFNVLFFTSTMVPILEAGVIIFITFF